MDNQPDHFLKIYFLDRHTLDYGDLDFSAWQGLLRNWHSWDAATLPLPELLADAEVLITNKMPINRSLISQAKKLKLICVAATGTNNIDLNAAREFNIPVCNVPGYSTHAVAEHVFALILALGKSLCHYQQQVRQGVWQQQHQFSFFDQPIMELHAKVMGIIGLGDIGARVAQIAQVFGMRVLVAQSVAATTKPHGDRLALEQLLPQVDILSIHCPLTPETRHLIGAQEIALMKPTALLINTARGGIVAEDALAQALIQGRLGGAGIDVLSEEPPRQGNVLLDLNIPNLLITPHIAWAPREARQRLLGEILVNIQDFITGKLRHGVIA